MTIRIIDAPESDTASRSGWAYQRQVKDIDFGSEFTWVAGRVLDDEISWARTHHGNVTVYETGYVRIDWPWILRNKERDQVFRPLHSPVRVTQAQAEHLRELLNRGCGTFGVDRNGRKRLDIRLLYSVAPSGWTPLADRGWIYEHGGRVYVSFAGRIALALYEARVAGKRGNARRAFVQAAVAAHVPPAL